jgi:hypothetical protein
VGNGALNCCHCSLPPGPAPSLFRSRRATAREWAAALTWVERVCNSRATAVEHTGKQAELLLSTYWSGSLEYHLSGEVRG